MAENTADNDSRFPKEDPRLRIRSYPDPVLAEVACPIEAITPEIRRLAEDMVQTMYNSEGLGLAAPQVGESCRLIVVDVSGPSRRDGLHVLVNPVIVSAEGETESEEGCLSVIGYRSTVRRHERVVVRGKDLDGREVELQADDILSVCLQHEIDHLDGVLFLDRISRLKRSFYDKKVQKWLKRKNRADD
jgi:peptide deformylase